MTSSTATYRRSFIVRVRKDETDAQKQSYWRYTLLDPEGETRQCFTSLDQLFAALTLEISDDTACAHTQSELVHAIEDFLGRNSVHLHE